MSSQGGRGEGQKLPILPGKKTTKRGGGRGQKSPILRRHSLWTAPKGEDAFCTLGDWSLQKKLSEIKPPLY